jgi:NRAMP (natural resistance-associated macrophage protein)-like metal ion transporter
MAAISEPPETSTDAQNIDLARVDGPGPVWRQYLRALGPGLVTGASDDDPSGIATYAQAGASFGLGMLWTTLVSLPLMSAVQEICDRTALATGRGLGELIVQRFSRCWAKVIAILVIALIVANALNIAADLVAVGAGMHLLHAGPTALWALIGGVALTVLLIAGSFAAIAQVFKLLCVSLLAYLGVLAMVNVSWGSVLSYTIVPHVQFSKDYIALLVAVLGTTISPYLFFWQTLHRVEEMREEPPGGSRALPLRRRGRRAAARKLSTSRVDVLTGMTFSTVVMFAIIVASAATLGAGGQHPTIASAAQAAEALRPIAGSAATIIFALGFIGSGTLAVPVLAGAGSAGMAGLLGKASGFSNSPRQAPVFYGLVVTGTIGGTMMSLLGLDPIRLLVISAIVNGIAAAPFLIIVMLIANDRRIMGDHTNKRIARCLGWTATALMVVAAFTLLATTVL